MYVWIWRHLPGAVTMKLLQTVLLVAAVAALLLFVAFPVIDPHLPINDVTVPNK
jgi:hypothetical protein